MTYRVAAKVGALRAGLEALQVNFDIVRFTHVFTGRGRNLRGRVVGIEFDIPVV